MQTRWEPNVNHIPGIAMLFPQHRYREMSISSARIIIVEIKSAK